MNRAERFERLMEKPMVTVGGRRGNSSKSFVATVKEIVADRSVLFLLVRRDIKSRYKDSALGLIWTLIRPLTQLAIYFVVIGKFLGAERGISNFAIYIFTGLAAFGLFQEIISGGTASILNNAGLVKKVYVPRELFPLATVGTALFNFAIQMGILLVVLLATGNLTFTSSLVYVLPAMIVLVSFGFALALILSAWFVYLRDIGYFVEVVMMVMLWASPILYSWQMVRDVAIGAGIPWLIDIYTANPATLAVLGFQQAFWAPSSSQPLDMPEHLLLRLIITAAIGLLCVIGAQRIFARLQGNFAQEL